MSVVFDSIKTRNLDQVYEFNLHQYYLHWVAPHIEGSEVDDGDYAIRISTNVQRPEFNVVLQTDVTDNFEEIYQTTSDFFSSKSLPYTWFIGPHTGPDNLKELLEGKRLRYVGDDAIVGTELDALVRNISVPNSLFIEVVNNQKKLDKWVEIYCTTKNIRGGPAEIIKRIFKEEYLKEKAGTWKKYLGWLNGEPVAASTLVTSAGIAVMYDETVLPRYKGWGIEEAINLVPLKMARNEGYKVGLVQTSIGGIKRFTQHTFEELFKFKKVVDMSAMKKSRRRR